MLTAPINVTGPIEQDLVSAIPGRAIHVISLELSLTDLGSVIFESDAEGNEIIRYYLDAGLMLILPIRNNEAHYFQTEHGKALTLAMTTGTAYGVVRYEVS